MNEKKAEKSVKKENLKSLLRQTLTIFFDLKEVKDEIAGTYGHIHAKVSFMPLVKIKNENRFATPLGPNRVVNFKKFQKVPKATQGSQPRKSAKNQLFKSFKEEPFDVNSQFELFMSSAK
jgi:hypothetical protein